MRGLFFALIVLMAPAFAQAQSYTTRGQDAQMLYRGLDEQAVLSDGETKELSEDVEALKERVVRIGVRLEQLRSEVDRLTPKACGAAQKIAWTGDRYECQQDQMLDE